MATRFFANEILDELLRLFDVNLRTSLNLKGVYRGPLDFIPVNDLPSLANGVWINMEPDIVYTPVQLPSDLQTAYNIRVVYMRRLQQNENALDAKIEDCKAITDMLWDNFRLPDLTLSGNPPARVMWSIIKNVSLNPVEEAVAQDVSMDIVAVALTMEIVVRTRR